MKDVDAYRMRAMVRRLLQDLNREVAWSKLSDDELQLFFKALDALEDLIRYMSQEVNVG